MKKTKTEDTANATNAGLNIKNFKSSAEVENFYRFVHENRLRDEARKLIEVALKSITPVKKRGRKKSKILQ